MSTIANTTAAPAISISLADFVKDFGPSLREAVDRQNPPIYRPENAYPSRDAVMDRLSRKPFPAQREAVQALSALLFTEGEKAAVLNGEMGTGKTMAAICVAAIAQAEGCKRTMVICPPHLVYKWRREIKETVPGARVWVLNGADTLGKLLQLREMVKAGRDDAPEFFVMGRVRMRMGFEWRHAFATTYQRGHDKFGEAHSDKVLCCPRCGTIYRGEDGDGSTFTSVDALPAKLKEKRLVCKHVHLDAEGKSMGKCGERLWTLMRKAPLKGKHRLVLDGLKKLPTIGDATAARLVAEFGEDALGKMLADNIYEFVNLMGADGELVFNDQQAVRIERALGNVEFSFGQGGYQPTEFIKRQLPAGHFGLFIADEAHEYKDADSAQGQAYAVLAEKASKVLLLTGTLMGGYATDLFYLLWRANPRKFIEDGYGYRKSGGGASLSGAAQQFLKDHGIMKTVYKTSASGGGKSHKTANGNKTAANESKAPGFGPTGICRYILPYTVFLKLKDIGGVLPGYREHYLEVDMDGGQRSEYDRLSRDLTQEMKKALAKGDQRLLGVVMNALLRWPETCMREETVCHPTTGAVLAYVPALYAGGERERMLPGGAIEVTGLDGDAGLTPKERKLLEVCKAEKAKGRKVLVYAVYTGNHDTTRRMRQILADGGLRTDVLRSTVKPELREDWVLAACDRGVDVLICNPELVKTGLDLLQFPTIVFMQTGYSVYTLWQASRRSWRIGQKLHVDVMFLGYAGTAQTACLALMAEKIAVSMSTSGDMPDSGLDSLNPNGDSVEVALARQMLEKAKA